MLKVSRYNILKWSFVDNTISTKHKPGFHLKRPTGLLAVSRKHLQDDDPREV